MNNAQIHGNNNIFYNAVGPVSRTVSVPAQTAKYTDLIE